MADSNEGQIRQLLREAQKGGVLVVRASICPDSLCVPMGMRRQAWRRCRVWPVGSTIRLAENESHTFQRGNAVLISSTTALKIRKRGGKWYVFVNYHGKRKAKCVGTSRELAEQVRRQLEARLTLGDLALFDSDEKIQTFGSYADKWLKEYARVECKTSTADGYEGAIEH